MEKGYAVLYLNISRGSGFAGTDLQKLWQEYRLHVSPKGSVQFLTDDNDVLYSILPDNEMRQSSAAQKSPKILSMGSFARIFRYPELRKPL